eukprot:292023-Chlamydomonas_euryale.AAC.3
MALRQLGRSLRSVVPALEARAASSSGVFSSVRSFGSAEAPAEVPAEHGPATTPTVFDKLITINVVDMTGHRHVVRSLVGKTLVEALVEAGFPEVRDITERSLPSDARGVAIMIDDKIMTL